MHYTELPLVSIITPSFNSAPYLHEAIASVQQQSCGEWEMIVVDDHSSDGSLQIAEAHARDDPRIRPLALPVGRKGAAHARNFAIEQSRGRYIAFLDSDDLWLPDKLERQIGFMRTNEIAFSYARYETMAKDGTVIKCAAKIPARASYNDLLKTCPIGCLTVVYDTKHLGRQYMPDIKTGQDYALWLQILRTIPTAHGLDEVLGRYRSGGSSLSSNKISKFIYIWKIYRDLEGISFLRSIAYMARFCANYIRKVSGSKRVIPQAAEAK